MHREVVTIDDFPFVLTGSFVPDEHYDMDKLVKETDNLFCYNIDNGFFYYEDPVNYDFGLRKNLKGYFFIIKHANHFYPDGNTNYSLCFVSIDAIHSDILLREVEMPEDGGDLELYHLFLQNKGVIVSSYVGEDEELALLIASVEVGVFATRYRDYLDREMMNGYSGWDYLQGFGDTINFIEQLEIYYGGDFGIAKDTM